MGYELGSIMLPVYVSPPLQQHSPGELIEKLERTMQVGFCSVAQQPEGRGQMEIPLIVQLSLQDGPAGSNGSGVQIAQIGGIVK